MIGGDTPHPRWSEETRHILDDRRRHVTFSLSIHILVRLGMISIGIDYHHITQKQPSHHVMVDRNDHNEPNRSINLRNVPDPSPLQPHMVVVVLVIYHTTLQVATVYLGSGISRIPRVSRCYEQQLHDYTGLTHQNLSNIHNHHT